MNSTMTVKAGLVVGCALATCMAAGCALFQKVVGVGVDHWAEAQAAYSRRKYDDAAIHYRAIKPSDPHYQAAQVGIGRCLWRQEKTNAAAEQMLGARKLDVAAFDSTQRLVRDLSLVYGEAVSQSVASTSDTVIAVFPRDEMLLLLSSRGTLAGFDDAGATQWEAQLGSRHSGARAHVAFDGGDAFSIAHDSKNSQVVALDPGSGARKWAFSLGVGNVHASADAASGSVYAPTRDGIVALNASDGEARWTVETPERFGQVIVAGTSVCAESSKSLSCWSAATGEGLGSYARPKRSDRGGLVSDGETLFFATDDAVYAVGIRGGMKLVWKRLVGSRPASPALDHEGTTLAVSTARHLIVLDAATGMPRVEVDKPPLGLGTTRLSPTPSSSGWLVAAGKVVYALDAQGVWEWIAGFDGTVTSAPVPLGTTSVLVAVSSRSQPMVMDVLARPW